MFPRAWFGVFALDEYLANVRIAGVLPGFALPAIRTAVTKVLVEFILNPYNNFAYTSQKAEESANTMIEANMSARQKLKLSYNEIYGRKTRFVGGQQFVITRDNKLNSAGTEALARVRYLRGLWQRHCGGIWWGLSFTA